MKVIKYLVITVLISAVLGALLVYAQQNKEYETSLEIKDAASDAYIQFDTVTLFPAPKEKYNQQLTGSGRMMYETELYTVAFIQVEADGYKPKRTIRLLDATKDNIIYLESLESGGPNETEEDVPVEVDEKDKVDLLPELKK